MGLVLLVVLAAFAVGAARGGSWRSLSRVRLRGARLVVLAVAAQVVGGLAAVLGASAVYEAGLVVSALVALVFCWRNLAVAGVPLVGVGLTLNALVVGLNGAMPVSYLQAVRAGADVQAISAAADPRHMLAGDGTRLSWLGDVVPVPLPLRAEVDSPGDVFIAAGLGEFVVAGMGRRRRGRHGWQPRQSARSNRGSRRPLTPRTPDVAGDCG
jgi:hypothetical protein